MNFDFSDDQKMLKDQARKFLDDTCTLDHVRKILEGDAGHDDAVWKGLCDLGFAGAAIPEQFAALVVGVVWRSAPQVEPLWKLRHRPAWVRCR